MSPVITEHPTLIEAIQATAPFMKSPTYRVTMVRTRRVWHASVRYIGGVTK